MADKNKLVEATVVSVTRVGEPTVPEKYDKYAERQWTTPSKRGKKFAEDLRAKVHTKGPKEGKPLTDTEKAFRRGYFLSQGDNAGIYKFKKGISEGMTKQEAIAYSKKRGKK